MGNKKNKLDIAKRKKRQKIIGISILSVLFLVPIGFGIYALIPDRPAPTKKYTVKLLNDYSDALSISSEVAYRGENFSANIKLDSSIIVDKVLPDSLGESDVLCNKKPISYTYSVDEDNLSAHLNIPEENIKGNITINVSLEEGCPHKKYSGYTIVDNKLYGICEKCGAQILISDEVLEGEEYKNKILVVNPINENGIATFTMEDASYMTDFISTAEANETLEMYLITGEYDLEGYRAWGDSPINIKAHGLFKNDGETLSATVDCTSLVLPPTQQYPRDYGNINFVFDDLNMKGDPAPRDFYLGLRASSITYNRCYFKYMQSLYSPTIKCNDCIFDARREGDAEYSFYGYNSLDVSFLGCKFYSDGKAAKIYSEGAGDGAVYDFNTCEFYNVTKKRTDKAAIEVDSTEGHILGYTVRMHACTLDGFNDLHNDDSNTEFIDY